MEQASNQPQRLACLLFQRLFWMRPLSQKSTASSGEDIGLRIKIHETRKRVRELLGRWFIPIRPKIKKFKALSRIAPNENVKRLIQETIERSTKTWSSW